MFARLASLLPALALAGCAGLTSKPATGPVDGLTYYLPKRDIVVTITVANGQITAIDVGAGDAYPDGNHRFVVTPGIPFLGDVTMNVVVNEAGLLDSADAIYASGIGEAATSLAGLSGRIAALDTRSLLQLDVPSPCESSGTYRFEYDAVPQTIDVDQPTAPCGLKLTIEAKLTGADAAPGDVASPSRSRSGLYFRQARPFQVTLEGAVTVEVDGKDAARRVRYEKLVFSPTGAPVQFVPVVETLFAKNDAKLAFEEGVLTGNHQIIEGELVAFLAIPAAVLDEYFSAIGSMFTKRSNASTNEQQALTSSLQLELARLRYQACIAAIRRGDQAASQELGCE